MNTTRTRASWVTQVSKRVEAHEEKGEPLGTTPDCLAVTAVGCVSLSAWHFFSLDILSDDATFSWSGLPLTSLNLDSPSSWQLWSPRLDTPFSPDNVVLISSLVLDTDAFSAAFRWRLFLLASLSLGISFLETFFSWHPLLSAHHSRFSLDTIFLVSFWLHNFFLWDVFLFKLLCLEAFCLDICFVLGWRCILMISLAIFFSWHPFSLDYYFVLQNLDKVLPSTLCTTRLAQRTSQYYFVIHSLRKILPSATLYYKASILTSITLTKQFHCQLQSAPCKSQYNCVDHGNQQHGCSHSNTICTPEFNFSMGHASEIKRGKTGPVAKVPHIAAGRTFYEKTQGFDRFLTLKLMWWCVDVAMWRCGDVVMWWCGDVMWWCDDVVIWWWRLWRLRRWSIFLFAIFSV